jgi:hypothetical protein
MSGARNGTDKSGRTEGALRILIDGWPLVHQPGGPAAAHILDLVGSLPAWVEVMLALPAYGPEGLSTDLLACLPALRGFVSSDAIVLFAAAAGTPAGRLRWEQHALARLAADSGAHLLHCAGEDAPLLAPVPVLISPVPGHARAVQFTGHLRAALGAGGLSRAYGVLWPGDLPDRSFSAPLVRTGPFVHPAYFQAQVRLAGMPEQYILAPGPLEARQVDLLAAAWRWASAGLGADWTLVACGLPAESLDLLRSLCEDYGASADVEEARFSCPRVRAALYQHASAVLYAGSPLPWGDPSLYALACGRPLAAQETEQSGARAGPAAFLTPAGDARALGAAVISLLVEEPLGEQFSRAGAERAAAWGQAAHGLPLEQVYAAIRAITGRGKNPTPTFRG